MIPAVNAGVKKDNNSREDKSLRAVLNFDPYAVKSEKLNILCRRPQGDAAAGRPEFPIISALSLESYHM